MASLYQRNAFILRTPAKAWEKNDHRPTLFDAGGVSQGIATNIALDHLTRFFPPQLQVIAGGNRRLVRLGGSGDLVAATPSPRYEQH